MGAPPGVGKRLKRQREEWPFPKGEEAPNVLVSTVEFMGYFFHRKHIPLWANIRYVVYDEAVENYENIMKTLISLMILFQELLKSSLNLLKTLLKEVDNLVSGTVSCKSQSLIECLTAQEAPRENQDHDPPCPTH